ncbi:MAG TPA: hypothetical protein VME43_03540 [Bryobacteraceae bacterium]|nr:hypothetical protein [Bryobacteraceae bacterium]
MNIVTAGMGHPNILSVNGGAHCGFEGVRRVLRHLQRIQFRPHCDNRSRLAAFQGPNHAGVCNPGPDIEAQRAQPLGDKLGCLEFAICELWMLMNLVSQPDHLRRLAVNGCTYGGVGDRGARLNLGPSGTYMQETQKKSEKCESDYHSSAAMSKIQQAGDWCKDGAAG